MGYNLCHGDTQVYLIYEIKDLLTFLPLLYWVLKFNFLIHVQAWLCLRS